VSYFPVVLADRQPELGAGGAGDVRIISAIYKSRARAP
jgi:hypothetical protein